MRPDERDLDDEIRGHLALAIRERIERGEDPRAARQAALADLGYPADVRESMRRVWYSRWFDALEGLRRDLVFAFRIIRKAPAFSFVAILTLAMAIAANAVVFGILNGFVLRPLDVPDPASLYGIEHADEHSMYESYPDYRDLRDRNRSFENLAGFEISLVGLDTGDRASRSWIEMVTANYFDALRLQPAEGRFFHASDDRGALSAPFIVLGHDFWHTRFQDDPSVIGRTVRVNTHPYTILGVAPKGFHGTLEIAVPDFYVPFTQQEQIEGQNLLEARNRQTVFMTFGHLKPGVTPAQAAADLNSIGAYLEKTYPNEHGTTSFTLARPGLYGNLLGPPLRAFVAGLLVLTGLVLLGACANLGSLFAARAADRSREIAVRLSLGASRWRIMRQLLTEALLISACGGLAGLWAGVALLRGLAQWQPFPRFPIAAPVVPDGRVYAIAAGLAIVSGLLFGLVPARQVLRTDPYVVIKAGPGAIVGSRMSLRDVLLVAQVAICAVLVTASFVAVRGLGRAMDVRFGFNPRGALLANMDLSMSGYTGPRAVDMQKRMVDAVAAVPGVRSAAVIGRPPLNGGGFSFYVYREDAADFNITKALTIAMRFQVSPEYFATAQTALLAGRGFTIHDDAQAPPVAIVNRHLATTIFGSVDGAVGRRIKARTGTLLQIVGVVEDGKYESLTEAPETALFLPMAQMPMTETCLVIRAAGEPAALAPSIRSALRALDPSLPVYVGTWDEQLELARFPARMATLALGVMGGIGIVLAVTGMFGMAAYAVSRRLRELGIRIALGARRGEVLGAALGRAFRLLVVGSIAGVLLGVFAARVLAAIVYQATPRDPLVLAAVGLVMLALGLVATWIPAQRALAANPLMLLREE